MKALRYLLILVAVMGVLSASAQTPKYGKPYSPSRHTYYTPQTQMPAIQMQSTGSAIMFTGSALPSAATEGVTTTYGPRKVTVNPGEEPGPDEGDNKEPWEDPIGDAMWPLLALASAYALLRVYRRKRRV